MKTSSLYRHLAGRSKTPTIVGIRHQIGLRGKTYWLQDTIRWLDSRLDSGDKVMLEIPEYPLGKLFTDNVFSWVRNYFVPLCDFIHKRNCEVIPGEDKERFRTNDERYHQPLVRDNEVFIPRMRMIRPRFFLVGFAHLDYLRQEMPEFKYVNLVDEEKDHKRCNWLNIDYNLNVRGNAK